jgi:phage terminase large subunit-like protein
MQRIVVSIDPAVSSNDESAETGIIIAGLGVDGRGYVMRDATCKLSPNGWASRAVNLFGEFSADMIVAEVNNGGDLVESTIRTVSRTVPYKAVRASRGKVVRAEPIAALYEQGRISHVGEMPELEDQLCSYVAGAGDKSPDRMDANVWALTELFPQEDPTNRWAFMDEMYADSDDAADADSASTEEPA